MRWCWVAALIAASFLRTEAIAQSERNQPGVQQPAPAVAQQKSPEEQRGTEQSPFIIKVAPTPKTESERADEAKDRERIAESERKKEKSDADLVQYTEELARFTKWLFVATVILGIATSGLLVAAAFQAYLTRKSIDLARAEFISTHRPKLRIRRIILTGFFDRFDAEMISHGDEVEAEITVVNVGGTPANIVDSRYRIYFYKDTIPLEIPYEDHPSRLQLTTEKRILAVGQLQTFEMTGKAILKDPGEGMRVMRQFASENWSMAIIGEITYRDDLSRNRVTGFLRVWKREGYFIPVEDPAYEYEG
jgi:hypothetical protein